MPAEEHPLEAKLAGKKGVVCLPYNIQVIMPYDCDGCEKVSEDLKDEMVRMFGGATVYKAEGFWIDDDGKIEVDKVKVIEAAHSCMSPQTEQRFVDLVVQAAKDAKQKAVSIKTGKYLIADTNIKDPYEYHLYI